MKENLSFVITGHVDHGKSTFIGRLLYDTHSLSEDRMREFKDKKEVNFAFITDHFREEREQKITIDTTQIFFKTDKRDYTIIDVPGHVEFMKNMITGASQADAAVLVVDAEEGVKEQTKRHSYILSLLGIKQVLVLVNKIDLIDYSRATFKDIKKTVEIALKENGLSAGNFIPVSAKDGDNIKNRSDKMPWYTGPLFLESIDKLNCCGSLENKPLIFPVQDVYDTEEGKIIVGKIEEGVVRGGQNIRILPDQGKHKVKKVIKYLSSDTTGRAGESVGIILDDQILFSRGCVICDQGVELDVLDSLNVKVFWISSRPLKTGDNLTLRCATQETNCTIDKIIKKVDTSSFEEKSDKGNGLKCLEVGELSLKTDKKMAIKKFNEIASLGRFVLCDNGEILGGGIF